MAEELKTNLSEYLLQLQQVDAALTSDPNNEELIKLQTDLQEVIVLTQELLKEAQGSLQANESQHVSDKKWTVGERCLAPWSKDQQLYEATVEEILDDGSCTVTFDGYESTVTTQISLLKTLEEGSEQSSSSKTRRDLAVAQREYKKKKAQKKKMRLKQLEEEKETERNQWHNFNAKTFSRTTKGRVKKSIFATPESIQGRVGVGTCNTGGKPMTQFNIPEKWKKS